MSPFVEPKLSARQRWLSIELHISFLAQMHLNLIFFTISWKSGILSYKKVWHRNAHEIERFLGFKAPIGKTG